MSAYEARSEDLAQAISCEMGAPIALARTDQVSAGLRHFKAAIEVLRDFRFEEPLANETCGHRILREPIGVCALITPWNWPMNQVALKVAPALAAGCTVVLKPSEVAPVSAYIFAEILEEAGIPAGVFNIVNGDGPVVGAHLSRHPDVEMVSFTGSTIAGKTIARNAADTVKRVTLELGGKGANIIFADADDGAVTRGVEHYFRNSGQSCNAPTRMLVERSRYNEAVYEAKQIAGKTRVASSEQEGVHLGPVAMEAQWNKVQNLIQKGIDEGARLVAGGVGKPAGLNRGWFVRPTIFSDVDCEMTIWRKEIFGPVLSITPFDDEESAVELANDMAYGLPNYVQTTDFNKARRVARALRSGMVEINGNRRSVCAPFGGYRQSGNGREGGAWGLEDYLEVKSVSGW